MAKRKKLKRKKIIKSDSKELIFKVPKNGLIVLMLIEQSMKKNTNYLLRIMRVFGKKKVNELIGLNHIQK